MISKESLELRKRKKQLGRMVRLLSYDPRGKSKIKVWLQRKCVALAFYRKKASYASYEVIDLAGVKTWRVTTPNSDPNKALLFFHGGAFVFGSPRASYPLATHLARESGMTVYVPAYRQAPEHTFPAQIADAVSVYQSLVQDYGYATHQIGLAGESAGGNLALVLILKLKEIGFPLPAAIICMSPWADPTASGETYSETMADKDPTLGPVFLKYFKKYGDWSLMGYYAKHESYDNPYVVPILGDFSGCPPVMIHVGTYECLLADARSMRDTLERSNCVVEYAEWEGMWHAFQSNQVPETRESLLQFGNFLNRYVH